MLKIAIVDDEIGFLDVYTKIVSKAFSEHHVVINIKNFVNGNEFIKSLSIIKYDLVFMDIDMPEISGIDIASELRNNNQNFDLIFVSAHPHFVFETIKYTPYRFIRKTNLRSETIEAVNSYCSRTNIKHKMLSLELQNGNTISEKLNDIIQFFTIRHDVYYTVKNDRESKRLSRKYSLSQIEELTKGFGFIRVHKSYIVNYRYIENIDAKSLLMTNGSEIPISHGKKTDIQERFMTLLRSEDNI